MSMIIHGFISYYNNPEYSDVTIQLSGGTIYAHRIILSTGSNVLRTLLDIKMKDLAGVVSFPEHSDVAIKTVIGFIYGKWDLLNRTLDEWCEIVYFANFLNIPKLLEMLFKNVHKEATAEELITIGDEIESETLIKRGIDLLIGGMKDLDYNTSQIEAMNGKLIRRLFTIWMKYIEENSSSTIKLSHFIPFKIIDCLDDSLKDELVYNINFHTFSVQELKFAMECELVYRNPLAFNLIKGMIHSRGSTFTSSEKLVVSGVESPFGRPRSRETVGWVDGGAAAVKRNNVNVKPW